MEVQISPKVFLKYTFYLEYRSICELYSYISARENTSRSLHNLWSNRIVDRVQVYQTRGPRFKTIKWLKNCSRLSFFQGQPNNYQEFLGTFWLKLSPHCDSAAFRHWSLYIKWSISTNKPWKGALYFVKYTWCILLKSS